MTLMTSLQRYFRLQPPQLASIVFWYKWRPGDNECYDSTCAHVHLSPMAVTVGVTDCIQWQTQEELIPSSILQAQAERVDCFLVSGRKMSERRLSLMQLQASLGTMERWSPPQSSQGTFGEYTSPEDGQLSTHAAHLQLYFLLPNKMRAQECSRVSVVSAQSWSRLS